MKWKSTLCGALLAVLGFAFPASATPIVGQLNIAGGVRVSATLIDWLPAGGGTGTFATTDPGTGYFSTIFNPVPPPFYTGTALDLSIATPLPLPNFLNTFLTPDPRYSDLSFTLTQVVVPSLPVCNGSETVGQSCVAFAGSPLILTRTSTGTSVEFDVFGRFIDPTEGLDSGANLASGVYSAQVSGSTPNELRLALTGANFGKFIGASYSAQFTATPEPVSMTLLGTGLLGVGFRVRRMRKGSK